jgi:SAM-dependent methyltransferase
LKVSSDVLDRAGVALLFAPERSLAGLWATANRLQRIRVDIDSARDVDLVADIRALPFADGSVDLAWCHHVLEHVEDDRAAIRSLAAVLKPGIGELIVSVPTVRGARTREFGAPDPFQTGHWRVYGDDFRDRLHECGLLAREIDFEFSKRQIEMYVLFDESVFQCVRA